jgi:Flp pilus assembly secretin CpaC
MAGENTGADGATAHGLRTLHDTLARAAGDPLTAARLAMVDATVLVSGLTEGDQPGVWLRFGDDGLQVGQPPANAQVDIRLRMPAHLLERFPAVHLSIEMAKGTVRYEGRVRELLAVMPVLRTAAENTGSATQTLKAVA